MKLVTELYQTTLSPLLGLAAGAWDGTVWAATLGAGGDVSVWNLHAATRRSVAQLPWVRPMCPAHSARAGRMR